MQIWQKLIRLGVRPTMSLLLQDRIRFANRMGLIMSIAGIVLTFVYLALGRNNILPLLGLAVFGLLVPFLNALGGNLLTRVLLSVAPPITALTFDIMQKGQTPERLQIVSYVSPRFVVLCSVMLPLVMFVYRERWLRFALALPIVLAAFNTDVVYKFFGVHFTQIRPDLAENLRIYHIQWVNYAIVSAILFTTTGFLIYTNQKNETHNLQILADAQATNARLQESEAKLRETLEAIQQSKLEIERRGYVSTGLVHFLKLLRQEEDFDALCQKVLSDIASYLHIQQGVVYWWNGKNVPPCLELRASYALTQVRADASAFASQEGLVGTAFAQKKKIHLKEIPESYTKITSGLGEGKARELLLLPLILHGKAFGVLEVSSVYSLEEHQIELLEQISETFAAALESLEVAAESRNLLESLQRAGKI